MKTTYEIGPIGTQNLKSELRNWLYEACPLWQLAIQQSYGKSSINRPFWNSYVRWPEGRSCFAIAIHNTFLEQTTNGSPKRLMQEEAAQRLPRRHVEHALPGLFGMVYGWNSGPATWDISPLGIPMRFPGQKRWPLALKTLNGHDSETRNPSTLHGGDAMPARRSVQVTCPASSGTCWRKAPSTTSALARGHVGCFNDSFCDFSWRCPRRIHIIFGMKIAKKIEDKINEDNQMLASSGAPSLSCKAQAEGPKCFGCDNLTQKFQRQKKGGWPNKKRTIWGWFIPSIDDDFGDGLWH